MYQFQSDYIKPKYGKKAKLCYMDTEHFIVFIKTDDIYKDIAEDLTPQVMNQKGRFQKEKYKKNCINER